MKLLFACQPNSQNFALPYLRQFRHAELITKDAASVHDVADQFDVVWLEWANDFTKRVVNEQRLDAFTIVRIHDWEIRRDKILEIEWDHVDAVWFINPDSQRDFNEKIAYPSVRQILCPNAVDMKEFEYVAEGVGHLGLIALNVQPRKRIDRAIELMHLLPDTYELTIRTSANAHWADTSLVSKLREQVELFNRAAGNRIKIEWREIDGAGLLGSKRDVVDFWRTKSHALSVADHEGFCYGIAEGMACGAAPAVLSWEWGHASVFYENVASSLDELADEIMRSEPSVRHRAFIDEHFSSRRLAPALLDRVVYVKRLGFIN